MGISALMAALCFFGGVAVCLTLYVVARLKTTKTGSRKRKKGQHTAKARKGMGAMDRILIILGAFLLCFIVTMVVIFIIKGSIPDTLVQYVFGACGLEGGVMGWIKTTKERQQDRRWARQDAREAAGNTYEEMEK